MRLVEPVLLSQLARELGLAWSGRDMVLEGVSPLGATKANTLTFATKAIPDGIADDVAIIMYGTPSLARRIYAPRPRLAFVKACYALDRLGRGWASVERPRSVHTTASVSPRAALGRGVVVCARTRIEANVVIADGVTIGEDCWIKSGAVIGEDGYGFERDEDGVPLRMLHFGSVVIGNDVEIGSLTTVCRGTLGDTVIEDHVKVDDHVHVAHNVRIKRSAMVVANVVLCGSVVVGERAWIAPNASVREGLTVGDDAVVGLGAVVIGDVPDKAVVVGNPGREREELRRSA